MKSKLIILLLQFSGVAISATPQRAMVNYVDLPSSARPKALAADAAGNLFIVSQIVEPSGRPQIRALKTDPQGKTLASLDFGGSNNGAGYTDTIIGAAVDSKGNLVIVGWTTSGDFPLVSPLVTNLAPFATNDAAYAAFIVRIDFQLKTILFSTTLGGTKIGTNAGAMTLDRSDNIYVTGSTLDTDFPVTAGAFQTKPPPSDKSGTAQYAYLTEISSAGKNIIFSTYFGSAATECAVLASSCRGTFGTAIALDAAGDIAIGGSTGNQLPATPGVFGPNCGECGSLNNAAGFVAKFAAGGSKLLWATYVPVLSAGRFVELEIASLAFDGAGNLVLGGTTSGVAVTAGALQPTSPAFYSLAGFLMKLDPAAQKLLFSTYFGGEDPFGSPPPVAALVTDAQGTIWVTGGSVQDELPVPNGTPILGECYLAGLSPDGSQLIDIFTSPLCVSGEAIALTIGGSVTALGTAGALLTVSPGQGPSLLGIGNSASLWVSNAVAPYELISIFGSGLGPASPAAAQAVDGAIAKSLNSVQVLFDGVPAPLLYVGPTQINAVVPSAVYGRDTTTIQIVTPSGTLQGPTMLVRPAQPGVFLVATSSPGFAPFAIALNQDGSLNSSENPAAPGSTATVWASGTGISTFSQPDGKINSFSGGVPTLPVSMYSSPILFGVRSGGFPPGPLSLEVLSAEDSVGAVAGVSQISFRLPPQASGSNFGFALQVGDAISSAFGIYLKSQQ